MNCLRRSFSWHQVGADAGPNLETECLNSAKGAASTETSATPPTCPASKGSRLGLLLRSLDPTMICTVTRLQAIGKSRTVGPIEQG